MSAQPAYPLRAQRGGLAPAIDLPPARMTPAQIPLTLSADVLRLPYLPAIRLVLAEIVSLYSASGCCDASNPHFAARLSINKDTVSEAISKLQADKLITRTTVPTAGGSYRTLVPNAQAIAAKAATNPYPESPSNPRRDFRRGKAETRAGNSGSTEIAAPEFPASRAGFSGYTAPENPPSRAGNSGANTPFNTTVEFTLPDDAASAAALGAEKKMGVVEILPAALPAEGLDSAPPVADAPPAKLHLMRLSSVATFPAFVEAWDAATQANPDTYADYAQADLLHYHTALLDWSNANGKKKIDWLATIRSSMRNDNAKGLLQRCCPTGVAASSPVLKRLQTAEDALALNQYDASGNRLN
jgi:hypothetical protein